MADTINLWPEPPSEIVLSPGEVHIWSASLDPPEDFLRRCEGLLSADERAGRRARFLTGPLRNHYTAARGTLRILLSRYFDANPAKFALTYQPHGKPQLAPPWNEQGLDFNLSHSGEIALYAFSHAQPIGVDVEVVRDMPNAAGLLERFFNANEIAQWRAAPPSRQGLVFFQGWTRKEAWLKAVGSGLSFPLDQFCVTMDGPASVLSIRGSRAEATEWRLESCEPCRGYVAAVAVRGPVPKVRKWRFEPEPTILKPP